MTKKILELDAEFSEFLKPMLKEEGLTCYCDLDLNTFTKLYNKLLRMESILRDTGRTLESAIFIGHCRIFLLRMFEVAERENCWFED